MNEDLLENLQLDTTEEGRNLRKEILRLVAEYAKTSHVKRSFKAGESAIPVSGKVYGELELEMLVGSSLDFWLTAGRFNDEFEKQLASFLGVNFVMTTNSGSSANLLALTSLTSEQIGNRSIKPNDEIITVAACFPTTVNPIIQNNLVPVFVDIELPSYNINTSLIENAITEKTKAIMIAHTLGNPFNIKEVISIAKKHNLWLIEDTCDALGSTYKGKPVGSFGDISTLSFYPAHQITMGEGGAVLTNNASLKRIVESFRDWGRDCFCATGMSNTCGKRFGWKLGDLPEGYDHKYTYSHVGYNLKITDMQAAIGLAQLRRLPQLIEKRKKNFQFLKKNLRHLEEFFVFPEATENSEPAWFGFPITIKDPKRISREKIISFLSSKRIDTRPLFAGNITKQPYFKNKHYRICGQLKNTDIIMDQSFWIGVFPGLNEEMLQYVVEQIDYFVKHQF